MAATSKSLVPVIAAGRALDIEKASREDLVRKVQALEAAAARGWLDRVYQLTVKLSAAQGHIYQIKAGEPWALQGAGFDSLNLAAGVTVTTVDEQVTWSGIIPETIVLKRIAVGFTPAGMLRVAPVQLTVHGKHYRFERIRKAGSYYSKKEQRRVQVDGFGFGTREDLEGQGLLGKPHQIWLPTETIGDVQVGYSLDTRENRVREVLEDGASFGKNLSRSATTIAGRLASKQWWGFDKLNPDWVREEGSDVVAYVPVVGYRNELQRQQVEAVAAEIARGADVSEAAQAAGIREVRTVNEPIEVNPEATDVEHQEMGDEPAAAEQQHAEDIAPEQAAPPEDDPAEESPPAAEPAQATEQAAPPPPPTNGRTLVQAKREVRQLLIRIEQETGEPWGQVLDRIGERLGLASYDDLTASKDQQAVDMLERALRVYLGDAPPAGE